MKFTFPWMLIVLCAQPNVSTAVDNGYHVDTYKRGFEKGRIRRSQVYTQMTYTRRSVYGCGFLWLKECYRYHQQYRSVLKDLDASCSSIIGSKFCYPGRCQGATSSCTCSDGFSGYDCHQIDNPPDIHSCLVSLENSSDDREEMQCSTDQSSMNFISNATMNKLKLNWTVEYTDGSNVPNRPSYIREFQVGIISSECAIVIEHLNGTQKVAPIHNCRSSWNEDNPSSTSEDCTYSETIDGVSDGDRVILAIAAKNGGYVKLNRHDSPYYDRTEYYDGRTTSEEYFSFTYDLSPPYCSEEGILLVQNSYTREQDTDVSWYGWLDDVSGIDLFEVDVLKTFIADGYLTCSRQEDTTRKCDHGSESNTCSLAFTDTGVYCILLTVVDKVGHYTYAMRYLLFDDDSRVTIKEHLPMLVASAENDTNYEWQTNGEQKVIVQWHGHFQNEDHVIKGFLSPINKSYLDIADDYDQLTGQPPFSRSRQGIPNVNGIIEFYLAHRKDHQGGQTFESAIPNWTLKENLNEEEHIDIPIVDGDTVKVWVRAVDVMGNEIFNSVITHIDSSAPVINDIYLTKDGVDFLAVHSSKELSKMCINFETFDAHSGVKQIEWKLYDAVDENILHGDGAVPRRQENSSDCNHSRCICIPKGECYATNYNINLSKVSPLPQDGQHDHDYVIAIIVTNNAMLTTTKTFMITVDVSPPLDGHVIDNRQGENDIDYQQGLQLFASWDGFFDRESGVMKYVYFFGHECLNSTSSMSFPIEAPFQSTTLTNAQWTAPGPGKYYCTVIAYNKALAPSNPVCSDGVTIDGTEPTVREVFIDDVFVKPGLLKDVNGTVWYINENRYRQRLVNQSGICRNSASFDPNIDLYPTHPSLKSSELLMQDDECTLHGNLTRHAFMRKETHIEITWKGGDEESGIFDYEVGLGSTSSSLDPDILPFASTNGHQHFQTYHPNLGEGVQFHIVIKAINRAGLTRTRTIGPFIVEVTPPIFHGDITVTLERDQDKDFMVARWDPDCFIDEELLSAPLEYEVAIDDVEGVSTLLPFASITDFRSSLCQPTTLPTCVAVPTNLLNWDLHGDHMYIVSIKVTNIAGLSVVATSNPYHHVVQLPMTGNVFETVSPNEDHLFGVQEDIDFQVDVHNIHCRWSGFSHPHQVVNYELGLGTSPDSDDTVNFHNVYSDLTYTFTGLTLAFYQKYYVIIRVSTEVGSITASSNGITILSDGDVLTDARVYDGPGCEQSKDNSSGGSNHHEYNRREDLCLQDVDFQASTSTAVTHWVIPDNLADYVTNVRWSLQRKDYINSSYSIWESVTSYIRLQSATYIHNAATALLPGHQYRALVKFCFPGGCFEPVASDGFWITSYPPLPSVIEEVTISNVTQDVTITWTSFKQQELQGETVQPMDYYEWTLSGTSFDRGDVNEDVLFSWQRITISNSHDQLHHVARTPYPIDFAQCIRLGLRGYNKAGLHTTIYKDITDCNSLNSGTPNGNIVLDSVGNYAEEIGDVNDIYVEDNSAWFESDREYTRSHHKLSAVWPTLQHGNFSWKVVSDQTLNHLAYHRQSNGLDFYTYECSAPEILACGQSNVNYVNVGNLNLKHGWRYYICVHANQTKKIYGNTQTLLPEVASCSNGIVADHTPPSTGWVWIGWQKQLYQASSTHLVVNWDGFFDVEEHGRTSHSSGIRRYEVAAGTSPGGIDIQDFQSVGVVNWIILFDLRLISGQTYYATVRAVDFVGLFTDAVSKGLTVDTSPPVKSKQAIDVGGSFITSRSLITAEWRDVFEDLESGIAHYEWCIGSKPGYANVFPCTSSKEERLTFKDDDEELKLVDGHVYYAMVKAYNGAGLSTTAICWALLVDTSPPQKGEVYDGCNGAKDSDYQIHLDYLCAQWSAFQDPHSDVTGYFCGIGSCPGCDDILSEQSLGLMRVMNASYLQLEPGRRYYTTIRACNAAGLCTSVTSDGIIPDNSPPVAGKVYDGIYDGDLEFQSSRTTLAAHWYNFHDPHSKLSHYEVRAGTTLGGDDILANTRLHLTEKIFISTLSRKIPVNRPVYVTVKAYNKAGLSTERSSNGVVVDETPPAILRSPAVDVNIGSFASGTQVWRSILRVSWQFQDNESPIQSYLLSVFTYHQSEDPASPIKVSGSFQSYTFTDLSLKDGDTYHVKVISCNAANLCTSSETDDVKIDSSQPIVGTFAVGTDHAAGLSRHRQGWMTYQQSQGGTPARVNLAWLGFSDIHSGISHYHVAVGSRFGLWDLTQHQAVEIVNQDGEPHFDEGVIQTASVDIIRNLVPGEHIYCTVWGVNAVGLRSYEAHESFVVTRFNDIGGILSLLRRCDVQTCQGDCTCAPQNTVCQRTPELCENRTGDHEYQLVDVYDVTYYHNTADISTYEDVDFTPSRCSIAARWRTVGNGIPIQRYEWSVGSQNEDFGSGLLDPAFDRLWHDAGQNTFAIFTKQDGSLNGNVHYVFYIKAWYDNQTYAIFTSDGVKPDYTPPKLSSSRKVKDIVDLENLVDVDYSTNTDMLGVSWKNVFRNSNSSVHHFTISVSTHPGGEDVYRYDTSTYGPIVYVAMLSGLNLLSGVTYYTNVMAINHVGLATIASSDGIMIDDTPPKSGVVFDGLGLHDTDYQNSSTVVSASWHGFSDLESSIDHYIWCVGRSRGSDDILPCHGVGLHLSKSETLNLPLTSGERYFSTVTAVDGAGLISLPAVSNGVILDTSAPVTRSTYISGQNNIENPSFEEIEEGDNGVNVTVKCTDVRSQCLPRNWLIEGGGHVLTSVETSAQSGNAFLILHGSVSQNIGTVEGDKYKLSFYASHTLQSTTPLLSQEGYVEIPGMHRVFHLLKRSGNHDDEEFLEWFEHVYYFTAESTSTTIKIGSLGDRNAIALDNVNVQQLTQSIITGDISEPSAATAISVDVRTDSETFSVSANWNMIDIESPIVEYLWAIGTVKGGTQIQTFKSAGRSTHAIADDLILADGLPIYITVVAKNAADLHTAIYSDPYLIDLTPPVMCCLRDGPNAAVDAVYQTSSVISVHWNVSDQESGIEYCEWAVGLSPRSEVLLSFTRSEALAFAQRDFKNKLKHGQTVYSTVRCHNGVGLFTEQISNGVIIIKEAPTASEATLRVVTSSPTIFESRQNHQANTDSIVIVWDGFTDITGISHYECTLVDDGHDSGWLSVGLDGETTAVMTGLDLNRTRTLTYQIQLRALNHGGFTSETITTNVTVQLAPPVWTGIDIEHAWLNENTVHLSWSGVFYGSSSLIYELTVTTLYGGSIVVRWFETRETSYQLTGIDPSMEYYLIVTAVNEAGLSTAINSVFSYSQ